MSRETYSRYDNAVDNNTRRERNNNNMLIGGGDVKLSSLRYRSKRVEITNKYICTPSHVHASNTKDFYHIIIIICSLKRALHSSRFSHDEAIRKIIADECWRASKTVTVHNYNMQ